jgi:hypothetical protein
MVIGGGEISGIIVPRIAPASGYHFTLGLPVATEQKVA